ncbi:hypothetical protein [Sphaerisporangium perillae]|nr:hypothetical protein [Sphaerisporangium perillae]
MLLVLHLNAIAGTAAPSALGVVTGFGALSAPNVFPAGGSTQ